MTVNLVMDKLKNFYEVNPQIKASHGLPHALAVFNHAKNAVACHEPRLTPERKTLVLVAALLHDVDDEKYFPPTDTTGNNEDHFPNALEIMQQAEITDKSSIEGVLSMISLVSCSKNGNSVPETILLSRHDDDESLYYQLIPRWADRIEAVGKKGVVRCYRFNQEMNLPLSSSESPRPCCEEQVWEYASPERFQLYQSSGGSSADMISHYYDKLLHVACPPFDIVRNSYLEGKLRDSAKELIEVCLRFGKTGAVDESYIQELEKTLA